MMTFSEFIIIARRRVRDLRTPSATKITTATEDGIRFSSAEMADICKGGLLELGRTLIANNKDDNVNVALLTQMMTVTAAASTGIVSGDDFEGYLNVRRLQQSGNADAIYDFVDPETFLSKRYRATPADSDDTAIDERYFTMFYDAENSIPQVRIVPIPASALTLDAFVVISFESLFNVVSLIDMPFIDIDDLMLDFVEREASRSEHDPSQFQLLTGVINNKLMELGIDIQKSGRPGS